MVTLGKLVRVGAFEDQQVFGLVVSDAMAAGGVTFMDNWAPVWTESPSKSMPANDKANVLMASLPPTDSASSQCYTVVTLPTLGCLSLSIN